MMSSEEREKQREMSETKKRSRSPSMIDVLVTYCSGPDLSSTSVITTKSIVTLIDTLSELFGPGYVFEPEPITEGGIVMTSWPNKESTPKKGNNDCYKSFRFHFPDHGKWPFIRRNTLESWRNTEAEPIWSPKVHQVKKKTVTELIGATWLKAFNGAPCWTPEEIDRFVLALEEIGFTAKNLPKKENLESWKRITVC